MRARCHEAPRLPPWCHGAVRTASPASQSKGVPEAAGWRRLDRTSLVDGTRFGNLIGPPRHSACSGGRPCRAASFIAVRGGGTAVGGKRAAGGRENGAQVSPAGRIGCSLVHCRRCRIGSIDAQRRLFLHGASRGAGRAPQDKFPGIVPGAVPGIGLRHNVDLMRHRCPVLHHRLVPATSHGGASDDVVRQSGPRSLSEY
jgi:hypothetical protein